MCKRSLFFAPVLFLFLLGCAPKGEAPDRSSPPPSETSSKMEPPKSEGSKFVEDIEQSNRQILERTAAAERNFIETIGRTANEILSRKEISAEDRSLIVSAHRNRQYGVKSIDLSPEHHATLIRQYQGFVRLQRWDRLAETTELLLQQNDRQQARQAAQELSKWVNKDGVLKPEAIDPSLPPGPFSDFNLISKRRTPEGQLARRGANRIQAEWAKTANSSASARRTYGILLASEVIKQADYAVPEWATVYDMVNALKLSDEILGLAAAAGKGVHDSLVGTLTSLADMTWWTASLGHKSAAGLMGHQPSEKEATRIMRELVINSPTYAKQIAAGIVQRFDEFVEGDMYTRAEIAGGIAVDVFMGAAAGGISKARFGYVGDLGNSALKLGDEVAALSRPTAQWLGDLAASDPKKAADAIEVVMELRRSAMPALGSVGKIGESKEFVMGIVDSLQSKSITTAVGKTTAIRLEAAQRMLPQPLAIRDIREGFTPGKIAVIGRKMGSPDGSPTGVLHFQEFLKRNGLEVEVFQVSKGIENELRDRSQILGRNLNPDEIASTQTFRENVDWIKSKVSKGYTIIDVGNPLNVKEASAFYNMELETVFGGSK